MNSGANSLCVRKIGTFLKTGGSPKNQGPGQFGTFQVLAKNGAKWFQRGTKVIL